MRFVTGCAQLQHRDGVLQDGESLQAVACNVAGTVLATLSQLQLHFWTNTQHQVYLTSVRLPGASLGENEGRCVMWHPSHANELAVVTSRRVLFYEADIVVDQAALLQPQAAAAPGQQTQSLSYCDAASRVCFRRSIGLDSGLALTVTQGSGHAFFVCTTTGVVYAIGWCEQRVVHGWTALSLRDAAESGAADALLTSSLTAPRPHPPHTPAAPSLTGSFHRLYSHRYTRAATGTESDNVTDASTGATLKTASCVLVPPGTVVRGGASRPVPPPALDAAAVSSKSATEAPSTRSAPLPRRAPSVRIDSAAAASAPVGRLSTSGLRESARGGTGDVEACFQGSILHVDYAARLELWSFAMSSGYVVLLHGAGDGLEGAPPPRRSVTALLSVSLTSLNATHQLLAVAVHGGGLACRAVTLDALSLSATPVWEHPRGLRALRAARCAVSALQWCPGHAEEVLCVGYHDAGVALVHYGGACLLRTVPGGAPTPWPGATEKAAVGCRAVCWGGAGTRLFVLPASSTSVVTRLDLGRVLRSAVVGPAPGQRAPLALLSDAAVRLVANSDTDGRHGVVDVVAPPPTYLVSSYPLRYGAVTSQGGYVVCAGRVGCAMYDVSSRRWHVIGWGSRDDAARFACVADPVWLGEDVVALPVFYPAAGRRFEITLHERDPHGTTGAVARVVLTARPTLLASTMADVGGAGLLLTLDVQQRLYAHRYAVLAAGRQTGAGLTLTPLRELCLSDELSRPLQLLPLLAGYGARGPSRHTLEAATTLHLLVHRRDHVVVCATLPLRETGPAQEPSCTFVTPPGRMTCGLWCDRTVPLPHAVAVVTLDGDGVWLRELSLAASPATLAAVRVASVTAAELLPLVLSDHDGYMLCAAEGQDAPGRRGELELRPLLYHHHILALLLRACCGTAGQNTSGTAAESSARMSALPPPLVTWTRALYGWLERMRGNGTFVWTMDYLLHTLLHESPPGGVVGLSRADALHATVALLRHYAEFYEVVVGCVRKMDTSSLHVVLDYLGTPLELYEACLAHNRLAEAVHLVRVIMMGSYQPLTRRAALPSAADATGDDVRALQQASACATRLFTYTVLNGDYGSAYDLVRFIMLLQHELGMPAVAEVTEGVGLWGWLRELTTRRVTASSQDYALPPSSPIAPSLPSPGRRDEKTRSDDDGDDEAAQRRRAMRYVFHTHPDLAVVVEQEATRLLVRGYVVQLCRLLATFAVPVRDFLRDHVHVDFAADDDDDDVQSVVTTTVVEDAEMSDAHTENDGKPRCAWPSVASVARVMDSLHDEFALPRAVTTLSGADTSTWTTAVARRPPPDDGDAGGVSGEGQRCVRATSRATWTLTQYVLYGTPGLLDGLLAIRALLEGYVVYELVLWLLLMQKAKLLELLCVEPEGAERRTDSAPRAQVAVVRLVSLLEALTTRPQNVGYAAFVADVVRSLPPDVLRASRLDVAASCGESTDLHLAAAPAGDDGATPQRAMQCEDVVHHDHAEALPS